MKKALKVTAVLATAVIFFVLVTLPPRPAPVETAGFDAALLERTVAGAFHVHTTRSDGAGDPAAVAAAARRKGLRFVIFTDHGDGTRVPQPPAYIDGVLCIDAVEISTNGGHYLALGLDAAAPYPLGGDADAVVEDVARLGGFGFAAHPDSARPELAWSDRAAPIDGLEWLNADSEWRDEPRARIGRLLVDYFIRPAGALASMLDRPDRTVRRWDVMTSGRRVVAIAGHDAHGGIGRRLEDGSRSSLGGIPSYDASFGSFAIRVVLSTRPTGDPAADAPALLEAIREGRVFTTIDAVASPAALDFRAGGEGGEAAMGGMLPPGRQARLTARAAVPPGARIVLLRNGEDVHSADGGSLDFTAAVAEGAYRVEVRVPGAPGDPPVPWLLGNPIYFLAAPAAAPAAHPVAAQVVSRAGEWRVEKDPHSTASLDVSDARKPAMTMTLGSAGGSPFVALVANLKRPGEAFDAIEFYAMADRPMRLSVQLRYPDLHGWRWGRSVYVDSKLRRFTLGVNALRPVDRQAEPRPDTALADSLLFVVDATNAAPGFAGRVELANLSLFR